ncbi:hypothetical protein [Thioalkalivibrio sp. ALE19]|uniref:hypothetical protein n=1 Tax=Thioalkalivibrio sp. ALE19 TaxID=1266909 RepID=UPI001E32CD4C|nr:hypothetical protein [Thioalkalivibrio sp. ALE19]
MNDAVPGHPGNCRAPRVWRKYGEIDHATSGGASPLSASRRAWHFHTWLLERLNALTRGRDAEAFLAHYRNKYHGGPDQPPIRMAVGDDGSLVLDQTRALQNVIDGYTCVREGDVAVAKITPCFENGKAAIMRGLTNGVGLGTTELTVLRLRGPVTTSS